MFIGSNGQITFNAGSADFTESEPEFFDGWGNPPNPGVALYYSDLNRNSTGIYEVQEGLAGPGVVKVVYRNQNHWSSGEPAGTFSLTVPLRVSAETSPPSTACHGAIVTSLCTSNPTVS